MSGLEKYTELELREELKKREEGRMSKTENCMYKCVCRHYYKVIMSRYP